MATLNSENKCFWCRKNFKYCVKSKDHIVSNPLWKTTEASKILKNRNLTCNSCTKCNEIRGKISSLYLNVKNFYCGKCKKRTVLKKIRSLFKNLLHFRSDINKKIHNQDIRNLCLQEIDEILIFLLDKEDIKTHAYYLWEKAGKQYGRSDEFWFEAEKQIIQDFISGKFELHPQPHFNH